MVSRERTLDNEICQSELLSPGQSWLDFSPPDRSVECVYIHVPFCAVKCHYCAFYSKEPDKKKIELYVDAIVREIQNASHSAKPRTIFFGGGTPSILPVKHLTKIFSAIQSAKWTEVEEWTVECNPATLNKDKVEVFKNFGVNRVSLGVQSMEPILLEKLGRIHTVDMVLKTFDLLRSSGFENINLDLMFAIPGQTLEMWDQTLERILSLGSEHMSCYELIYEEDTPLFKSLQAGEIKPNEELAEQMYLNLIEKLRANEFYQYEVANFARDESRPSNNNISFDESNPPIAFPKYACQHNLNYWLGGSYLGLGPSANGFINGFRYQNVANTSRYCEMIDFQGEALEWKEKLSDSARAGEIAAFGFRTSYGWDLDKYYSLTGIRLEDNWGSSIKKFIHCGWMESSPGRIRLTPQGLRFADSVALDFID